MQETLIELKESKKRVVTHLLKKTECDKQEIRKLFGKSITIQWFNRIMEEMNHSGLILFRTGEKGENLVRVDKTKIVTKRATDKFKPDLLYMLIVLGLSLIFSMFFRPFLTPFLSLSLVSFMLGSVFAVMMIVAYFSYKIFKTPEMMQIFYKKPLKRG